MSKVDAAKNETFYRTGSEKTVLVKKKKKTLGIFVPGCQISSFKDTSEVNPPQKLVSRQMICYSTCSRQANRKGFKL